MLSPDPDFLGYWYDHSARTDWLIEGADFEVLDTAADQQTDKPNYIRPKCFPALEGYDYDRVFIPISRHHHHEPEHAVDA